MAQKIFIVEDDAVIAKTISDYLNRWAFAVSTVTKFDQVDAEISAAAPDLVTWTSVCHILMVFTG